MTHRDNASYLQDLERGTWGDDGTLPPNWEELIDAKTGRQYYVDHNTKTTSWVDPRDIFIKPFDFSACQGQELAFGWELAKDNQCGEYFVDHGTWTTTLTDPRVNTLNRMLGVSHDAFAAASTQSGLVQEKLEAAQTELRRLQAALRNVEPLAPESVSLQRQISAQLEKVMQLQEELEMCRESLDASRAGLDAMVTTFSPRQNNEDQQSQQSEDIVEANEKMDRLLRAQNRHVSVTTDRLSELEMENHRIRAAVVEVERTKEELKAVLEQGDTRGDVVTSARLKQHLAELEAARQVENEQVWNELHASAELYMTKPDLVRRFAKQQREIDQLRSLLPKNEYTGMRVWDEDLQSFVQRDAKHAEGEKIRQLEEELASLKQQVSATHSQPPSRLGSSNIKDQLISGAGKLGDEIESLTADGGPNPSRPRRTSSSSIGSASDPRTPETPNSRRKGVHDWGAVEVRRWLQSVEERDLAARFGDAITGNILLELSPHDLEVYGVHSEARVSTILLKITQLMGHGDPIKSGLKLWQWDVLHVRYWLIDHGLTHLVVMFWRNQINGGKLHAFTRRDLLSLNVTADHDVRTIMELVDEARATNPVVRRSSIGRTKPSDCYARPYSIAVGDLPGSVLEWSPDHVKSWLRSTSRNLTADMVYAKGITGVALLELQDFDLAEFEVRNPSAARDLLVDITALVTPSPTKTASPMSKWSYWQVRAWLLESDLTYAVSVMQTNRVDGARLLELSRPDLKDYGLTGDHADLLLRAISRQLGEGESVNHDELSLLPRRERQNSLRAKRVTKEIDEAFV